MATLADFIEIRAAAIANEVEDLRLRVALVGFASTGSHESHRLHNAARQLRRLADDVDAARETLNANTPAHLEAAE